MHSFWLFSWLQSCLSRSQRQSKCNLVEGMTALPTVAATAARLAPRLCPKAFYVILKATCVLCGYILLLQRSRFRGFVCEHMVLPLHFFHDVTLLNLIQIPFVENVVRHCGQRRFALALWNNIYVWKERKLLSDMWTVSRVRWSCTGNISLAVSIISMDCLFQRGRSAVIR